jgi:hypothetical protein
LSKEALPKAAVSEGEYVGKRRVTWGFQTVFYFEQSPALEVHTPIPELTLKEERAQEAVVDLREIFGEELGDQEIQFYTRRRRRAFDLEEDTTLFQCEEPKSTNAKTMDFKPCEISLKWSSGQAKLGLSEECILNITSSEQLCLEINEADSLEQETLFKFSLSTQEDCSQDPIDSPRAERSKKGCLSDGEGNSLDLASQRISGIYFDQLNLSLTNLMSTCGETELDFELPEDQIPASI